MVDSSSSPTIDLGQLSSGLSQTCTEYLDAHRSQLARAIREGQRGPEVARRYSSMFDGLFSSLFCASLAALREKGAVPERLALVAVGGYGRQLVGPGSDVDVLFLCDTPDDPRVVEFAEAILYPLWDAGVDVGHAVRGLDETLELSRNDIRTSTTLLDMRHVAGDREIIAELTRRGRIEIFGEALDGFLDSLEADTRARHERFGGSLYLREPEIKLGRGGLRDLDVVLWCARARWGVDSVEALVACGALTSNEGAELERAQASLWTIRNVLHLNNRRRHDRLTFEDQEKLAELLGYRGGLRTLGVEDFMAAHYANARIVARLVDCMPDRARRSRRVPPTTIRDLGGGIMVHDGQVTLRPDALREAPAVALRLYRAVLREGLPPSSEARDAISAATEDRDFCRELRADVESNSLFLQLISRAEQWPLRGGSLLGELHETRLLLAIIPEFEPVTGRVRFDAHHVYTVDAHAVVAVDRLRALCRGDLATDYLLITRCAAEMPRPVPLYLAVLLHGLGANHPDHPERHGSAIAGSVAERLGLDGPDIDHLRWLIRQQNALYRWALRRDITDPETIQHVVGQVKSVHRLRDLYLLTFATLSTVSPTAMGDWTSRMLEDLWLAASESLEGRSMPPRDLARAQREATDGIEDEAARTRIEHFLSGMPERYLKANTTEGIRWHADAVAERGSRAVVSASVSGVGAGTYELLVATDDRPGLLADLTAALATTRFSVDAAQLYTRRREGAPPEAFDLFHLRLPDAGMGLDQQAEIERLTGNIHAVLDGTRTPQELLESRPRSPSWKRPGPRVRTEINIDNAASGAFTVIDVYTRDRKDLLHAIARTLHENGLSIALAKVNTEGTAVADVFYVQTVSGGKLAGDGSLASLSKRLRDTIRGLDDTN